MSSNEFRKIIDTLENITEAKIGRAVDGDRGQWVTSQHISNDPIPFSDQAPDNNDANWMKRVAFGNDFRNLPRVYIDQVNKKFPFVGKWSDSQDAYVYFPDNTAKTLGKTMAAGIRQILTDKGMEEGRDFVLDQQHELLRIFKKTR